MKDHHEYPKQYIGWSDIASLTLRTSTITGLGLGLLNFGGDGQYSAYIVDEDVIIPDYYKLAYVAFNWLWIYSDSERTARFDAKMITVYRAGDYGCIIKLYKEN